MKMRISPIVALVWTAAVWGQPKPPLGILRGELSSWTGSWDGGALQLKLESGMDYECQFNSHTFFDRDRSRISVGRLRPGDLLEIVSDRTSVGSACFARMVKIVAKLQEKCPGAKILLLAIFPRGANADDKFRKQNEETNAIIKGFADNKKVYFLDINAKFLRHAQDDTLAIERAEALEFHTHTVSAGNQIGRGINPSGVRG